MTIDPDVASELERIRTTEGRRFKHVLNDVLRAGLRELSSPRDDRSSAPITVPQNLGTATLDIVDVSAALARAEGEHHR